MRKLSTKLSTAFAAIAAVTIRKSTGTASATRTSATRTLNRNFTSGDRGFNFVHRLGSWSALGRLSALTQRCGGPAAAGVALSRDGTVTASSQRSLYPFKLQLSQQIPTSVSDVGHQNMQRHRAACAFGTASLAAATALQTRGGSSGSNASKFVEQASVCLDDRGLLRGVGQDGEGGAGAVEELSLLPAIHSCSHVYIQLDEQGALGSY